MGVPSYFRWLRDKYSKILYNVIEESWVEVDGVKIPPDASQPNPNNIEFDNLYLDMNGIIHPCSHPENEKQPESDEEIMQKIFEYIDRIFCIVRPRRLLFMAIDGVAPRAKMNQQRSRRFRAARENKIKQEIEKERIETMLKNGLITEEEANTSRIINESKRQFDSNCITPGTEFMEKVANALRWYAHERMNKSPGWKNIQVIISDASVPGEGEHKIMEFIRKQRELPMYDPNTSHVLYGLDADLIMLGISTHEPNFTILREYVSDRSSDFDVVEEYDKKHIPYQFLKINVLREYLENDLYVENLPFKWDLERALDDYVFMCFFVGNDFLPHLPTLNIRERAIDFLIEVYRKLLPRMGGYITENGDVNLLRAEMLLSAVGEAEDRILRDRLEKNKRYQERRKNNRNKAIADALRNGDKNVPVYEEEKEVYDPVRLGEEGWKERYYQEKFGKSIHDEEFITQISKAYVEGLAWVMKYYYQGCCSWTWYYPYHYAPFAGELKDLEKFIPLRFDKGSPFFPYEQLMSVLPSASCQCLPEIYHWYMKDKNSPIYEYYPLDFEIDMNGEKQEWRGVALLPFIDEQKLLSTIRPLHEKLTGKEKKRNSFGKDLYLVHSKSPVGTYVMKVLYEKVKEYEEKHGLTDKSKEEYFDDLEKNVKNQIHPKYSKSISGTLSPVPDGDIGGTVKIDHYDLILNNQVYSAHYANPEFPEKYVFVPRVLENAVMLPRVLSDVELVRRRKIRHFGKDMSATRILEYVTNSNRLYNDRNYAEGNLVKSNYRMTDHKTPRYEPYAKKTGHKQQYHQNAPSQYQQPYQQYQQYQQPTTQFPYQYPQMLLQPTVQTMNTPYQPYPNLQYPVFQNQYPPQQIPYNPYQQIHNPYQIQQNQTQYPYQQPQHQTQPQQYHVNQPQQQQQQQHQHKNQSTHHKKQQNYQQQNSNTQQQKSQYQSYFKKR